MFYSGIRRIKGADEKKRTISNLQKLRKQLTSQVPAKDPDENLLLATWNIRDFGKSGDRRGFGKRLPEMLFYIAEVISRFDIVAVQEVNAIEPEWTKVMRILGSNWEYVASDVTDPAIGGNGERMVFVYDKRKVSFQSVAGEIVLPPSMLISRTRLEDDGRKITAGKQFRRTPFIASFQSGWLKFDLCTVHIYFGKDSGAKLKERIEEIKTIANYLSTRADRAFGEDRALFLLGDFNIKHPDHQTMEALVKNGFKVPKELFKSNIKHSKYYDQIAFKTKPGVLEYVNSRARTPNKKNAGVVRIFDKILTPSDAKFYAADAKKSRNGKKLSGTALDKYFTDSWRTYQFSDHRPLWVRLKTDESDQYLKRLAKEIA